jgi:hypothetical protein
VPHLLWQGTSVLPVSSEGLPHSVTFYDTQGCVDREYILTQTSWVPSTLRLNSKSLHLKLKSWGYGMD